MKKQLLILGSIIGLIFVVWFWMGNVGSSGTTTTTLFENLDEVTYSDGDTVYTEISPEIKDDELHQLIFVDVQGEVVNPGMYSVSSDKRVGYVIQLAGGLTMDANARGLNQAARIYDEMIIYVPNQYFQIIITDDNSPRETSNNNLISISTASAPELQSLPGIGPVLSNNIIEHRNTNGPFNQVDELLNVPGLGRGTLDAISEFIKP